MPQGHQPATAPPPARAGSVARAFFLGLALGLVVGIVAGVMFPPLLASDRPSLDPLVSGSRVRPSMTPEEREAAQTAADELRETQAAAEAALEEALGPDPGAPEPEVEEDLLPPPQPIDPH